MENTIERTENELVITDVDNKLQFEWLGDFILITPRKDWGTGITANGAAAICSFLTEKFNLNKASIIK